MVTPGERAEEDEKLTLLVTPHVVLTNTQIGGNNLEVNVKAASKDIRQERIIIKDREHL